jgi:hypothetical protein
MRSFWVEMLVVSFDSILANKDSLKYSKGVHVHS